METGVMSESLVVPSDVHQTVTEVLGQLVLDDFKQTDLCVLINKKGVDTMRFRHTGKSPRRNLKTKLVGGPICLRFSWRRSDWWAPETRFF